ncbi:hypothetical protein DsansV1_C10g0098011 [Dioscorea sansibarensis]
MLGNQGSSTWLLDRLPTFAESIPPRLSVWDFPHSQHECINFPFNSTPHAKDHRMCHCCVCDLPAPCGRRGNGVQVLITVILPINVPFEKKMREKLSSGEAWQILIYSLPEGSDTTLSLEQQDPIITLTSNYRCDSICTSNFRSSVNHILSSG